MSKTVIALPQDALEIVSRMLQDVISSAQVMQKDIFDEKVTNENLSEYLSTLAGCEKWLWEELLTMLHQDIVDNHGGSEESLMEELKNMMAELPEHEQKVLKEALGN